MGRDPASTPSRGLVPLASGAAVRSRRASRAQALTTLENAGELPAAARADYRFLPPGNDARRARWDRRFQEHGNHDDLEAAAVSFQALAADDPEDAAAHHNAALCFAWLGRNLDAIALLSRAVDAFAGSAQVEDADFTQAVSDWTLAEVLRQGAGAETLADDLRYVWTIAGVSSERFEQIARRAAIVSVPAPLDPVDNRPMIPAGLFEWLDRPLPDLPDWSERDTVQPPRQLATVVRTDQEMRLSSPDAATLETLIEPLERVFGAENLAASLRREAAPLPLTLLDASVWTFRRPPGLDAAIEQALTRGAVESHFEDRWIHVPRHGLDGLSPLSAARLAANDGPLRARLLGIIRLREQLGQRTRTAALYQGYPFDRLRRRLGLPLNDPESVDPVDFSCMSAGELDALDLDALDDFSLAEACASSAGLGDDVRTARFAGSLLQRGANPPTRLGLPGLVAPLLREALASDNPRAALDWLEQVRGKATGPDRRTLDTWMAEVLVRIGEPDAALDVYQSIVADHDADRYAVIDLALGGVETLADGGHPTHAEALRSLVRSLENSVNQNKL